jgi:hypothetical protein
MRAEVTSASMARSAGSVTFLWAAANAIALMKQADQPAANRCSGLVPAPEVPGVESLTSRRPPEVRDAPSPSAPLMRRSRARPA